MYCQLNTLCEFLQCLWYIVAVIENLWLFLFRFVADNRIDCNAAYLNILCRGFLASDGATCIDYGMSEYNTEPLDSVCDGELLDC